MCDTAVVVSSDGVLFAKSSDRDPNEAQVLEWHPRRSWNAGEPLRCTWLTIPQVAETHATILSRPFWMWGAEIGANEHGVVIGNEAVFTRHKVPEVGLTGMDLVRLALERASSAALAVQTILELAERHGQGGRCGHEVAGFRYFSSFIVADRSEAYVLETAGPHSAVERVRGPRSISNGLTIEGFAREHSDLIKTTASNSRARRACTTASASRARDAGDMFALLREHGHPVPSYSPINGAMAGPCVHAGGVLASSQSVASWVTGLDGRHWATGTAAPCTSLFKPIDLHDPIDVGHPTDRDDGRSLWWRHERFHRAVMRDPARQSLVFANERDELESKWLRERPSSRAAFAEGDALLERWSTLIDSAIDDTRPIYTRRYWRIRRERARWH
jgi:secernin